MPETNFSTSFKKGSLNRTIASAGITSAVGIVLLSGTFLHRYL